MVELCSLKGTTKGEDLFIEIDKTFKTCDLLKKLTSVTTDGGRNLSGINIGLIGRINAKMKEEQSLSMKRCNEYCTTSIDS